MNSNTLFLLIGLFTKFCHVAAGRSQLGLTGSALGDASLHTTPVLSSNPCGLSVIFLFLIPAYNVILCKSQTLQYRTFKNTSMECLNPSNDAPRDDFVVHYIGNEICG